MYSEAEKQKVKRKYLEMCINGMILVDEVEDLKITPALSPGAETILTNMVVGLPSFDSQEIVGLSLDMIKDEYAGQFIQAKLGYRPTDTVLSDFWINLSTEIGKRALLEVSEFILTQDDITQCLRECINYQEKFDEWNSQDDFNADDVAYDNAGRG